MQVPIQAIPAFSGDRLVPMDKMAVHRQGLRHLAVSVFVTRGDRILLQQRALTKYHTPGLWANTCCTHPHWGEAPATCAARRLDEELGLAGLTLLPVGVVEYRADVQGGMVEHEVVDIFTAEAPPGLEPRPNPDEVASTAWIALDALRRDVRRRPGRYAYWLRYYLEKHSAAIQTELRRMGRRARQERKAAVAAAARA